MTMSDRWAARWAKAVEVDNANLLDLKRNVEVVYDEKDPLRMLFEALIDKLTDTKRDNAELAAKEGEHKKMRARLERAEARFASDERHDERIKALKCQLQELRDRIASGSSPVGRRNPNEEWLRLVGLTAHEWGVDSTRFEQMTPELFIAERARALRA